MQDIDEIIEKHQFLGPGFEPEMDEGWYLVEAVLELHETLQPTFEEFIQKTGPTHEALVAGQITARAVSLISGIAALDRAGEFSTALSLLRTVEENASNLFYILFAGPAHEGRSKSDLAEQFLAYRDVDHAKFVNKSRAEYIERFKKGWKPPSNWTGPRTLAAFEKHCDDVKADAATTRKRFPKMGDGYWHSMNKEDRTKKVLEYLPGFAEPIRELWASEASITGLHNTLLHSGPMLFHKEAQRIQRGHILDIEVQSKEMGNQSLVAAMFAEQCWLALGHVLGVQSSVEAGLFDAKTKNVLALTQKHHVPAMWRLDKDGRIMTL